MIVKLNQQELQQMITEAVKKVEERISPTQVFAGLIWHYCINAQDHFYKGEYYDLPVSFQYDNDGVSVLEVNYLKQSSSWTLLSPDYKHVLLMAPLVLKWMDDTYFAYVASKQQAHALDGVSGQRKRRGVRRRRQRPRKRAIALSPSALTTPLSQPQPSPRRRPQAQMQAKPQERQKDQRSNQGNDQNNGDSQSDFS